MKLIFKFSPQSDNKNAWLILQSKNGFMAPYQYGEAVSILDWGCTLEKEFNIPLYIQIDM